MWVGGWGAGGCRGPGWWGVVGGGWGCIQHDNMILYTVVSTTVTTAEHNTKFVLTKDTPYLALAGELGGVYYDAFQKNWSSYNSTVVLFVDPQCLAPSQHWGLWSGLKWVTEKLPTIKPSVWTIWQALHNFGYRNFISIMENLVNKHHNNCNRWYMKRSWHGNSFCITGCLWGNSPVTGGFPSQMASNAEHLCLICFWTSWWTYIRVAGDLKCMMHMWYHCKAVFYHLHKLY